VNVGVTGASGYVGSMVLRQLHHRGMGGVALSRNESEEGLFASYSLGEAFDETSLDGLDAVIHAAHDFSARGERIFDVNYRGSKPLLRACRERGLRVVLVSSLSAHSETRSWYGRAKLALESDVRLIGGSSVRAGIVFGTSAGGIFRSLVRSLNKARVVPVPDVAARLHVTHDERLVETLIDEACSHDRCVRTVLAASEGGLRLTEIAKGIATASDISRVVIPIPASIAAGGAIVGEAFVKDLPFRADSILSLMAPMPPEEFNALTRTAMEFPGVGSPEWVCAVKAVLRNVDSA
jgi:nucleoside-diphosphate-sugar epimerase